MKLTFLGADREVTGSCTQLEAAGHRFLIDCGMEQGRDVYENADLPCAPGTYEALLLTRAHIDHSGRIPYLYKNGYRGPIYTTDATRDLCAIMLEDSAHIQEQEAEWKNRKAMRSGAEMIEPDYTVDCAIKSWCAVLVKFFVSTRTRNVFIVSISILLLLLSIFSIIAIKIIYFTYNIHLFYNDCKTGGLLCQISI